MGVPVPSAAPSASGYPPRVHLRVGTSGFAYKEWLDRFYPADLPAAGMLRYYAEHFPAVEINNTFYQLPKVELLAKWAEQVPESFRFVLKASQRITHLQRLRDCEDTLTYLLRTAAAGLGDRLGPLLFQLPPNFRADRDRLAGFLDLLPRERAAAFEFRHPSWDDPAIHDLLRERGVALCVADVDEEPPAEKKVAAKRSPKKAPAGAAGEAVGTPGKAKAGKRKGADVEPRHGEAGQEQLGPAVPGSVTNASGSGAARRLGQIAQAAATAAQEAAPADEVRAELAIEAGPMDLTSPESPDGPRAGVGGSSPATLPPIVGTADWGYLRLRRFLYDEAAMHRWILALETAARTHGWREVYVFFKHEDEGTGPRFAATFAAAWAARAAAGGAP